MKTVQTKGFSDLLMKKKKKKPPEEASGHLQQNVNSFMSL